MHYLFRGYTGKEWVVGSYVRDYKNDEHYIYTNYYVDAPGAKEIKKFVVDKNTIGIATGIDDNNGRHVFQNDVYINKKKEINVVILDTEEHKFMIKNMATNKKRNCRFNGLEYFGIYTCEDGTTIPKTLCEHIMVGGDKLYCTDGVAGLQELHSTKSLTMEEIGEHANKVFEKHPEVIIWLERETIEGEMFFIKVNSREVYDSKVFADEFGKLALKAIKEYGILNLMFSYDEEGPFKGDSWSNYVLYWWRNRIYAFKN